MISDHTDPSSLYELLVQIKVQLADLHAQVAEIKRGGDAVARTLGP